MSKVLVIVESPAKAKTISRFLGKKYLVKASMGHVRDLPKSQLGVDVEAGFEPKYITIRGKGEITKELKGAAKNAEQVLLATDPDREGEAIAWHLQQVLEISAKEACRIEFNEITKTAISAAVKKPRPVNLNLVDAQQARRILDRLVGYSLSPLLWRKVKKGLSAGRVQSVAVKLIADREEEISRFEPEEYWSLTAGLKQGKKGPLFHAKLVKEGEQGISITNKEAMDRILHLLRDKTFSVAAVKTREKHKNPAAPFITSSLQQEAYRKLNFTARKTMMVAQQLYEGIDLGKKEGITGLITYIRTDSTRISNQAQDEAFKYISEKYGKEYLPPKPRQFTGKKQAQDAHEAIRPSYVLLTPDEVKGKLTPDQYKLYRLIWSRFVASQMAAAVLDITTAEIKAGDFFFRVSGSIIRFPGFLQVYEAEETASEDENGQIPELNEGTVLILEGLHPKQHFTQPPPRYSEASLVKALEEKGIGRPSTYAPIIETILSRGYVAREQKQFLPTELGMIVIELLSKYFSEIVDVEFTAGMEQKLDHVEEGEVDWKQAVDDFYRSFKKMLVTADKEIEQVQLADEITDEICEKCGRNMVLKLGRFGKFLACPGFPECRNTKPLLENTGVNCPLCSSAIVVRRTKKGRKFFGCFAFPDCEYTSWHKPTMHDCPQCKQRMVEKSTKQGIQVVCQGPNCGFRLEEKDDHKQ
ncbi:MAG: type I DNA topoisomerase [Syntrophomonadaceae bacterium]|nr:type I DNA topoisomerase [Syntrophomonadaceae bacterium]